MQQPLNIDDLRLYGVPRHSLTYLPIFILGAYVHIRPVLRRIALNVNIITVC